MDCIIETDIARLSALPLGDLRRAWQRHHPRMTLPDRLPRDLLVRTSPREGLQAHGRTSALSVRGAQGRKAMADGLRLRWEAEVPLNRSLPASVLGRSQQTESTLVKDSFIPPSQMARSMDVSESPRIKRAA